MSPDVKLEPLVPDYRGRMDVALAITEQEPPDVFNHNLETVPRLYKAVRPGSDFEWSLDLLEGFKKRVPHVPTKSGLMLGLGQTDDEVIEVMKRMREHGVDMLTLGQYLQPSRNHLPVQRFVHPKIFANFAAFGQELGFKNIASGPLVRSSYHADVQATQIPKRVSLAQVREGFRNVKIVASSAGQTGLDPSKISNVSLADKGWAKHRAIASGG